MSQLIERLRAEIAFHQADAAAWGVDTYGALPRYLGLLKEAADALSALTQPSPNPTAAGGYVLVPVEPTDAMLEAGLDVCRTANRFQAGNVALGLAWLRGQVGSVEPGRLAAAADAIEAMLPAPLASTQEGEAP